MPSTLSAVPAETARESDELHRSSIVIDSLGPEGPRVVSTRVLAALEELGLATDYDFKAMLEAMKKLEREENVGGSEFGRPGLGNAWDQCGVTASSTTMGAFGARPFSHSNAVRDLARMHRMFEEIDLVHIRSAADIERTKAEGKHGLILNFQNTDHLEGDLDNVDLFYGLGIRVIQLTYNDRNLVGDGCSERTQAGLSYFGVDLVKALNERGILVDVSHCGEGTTLDAIELSDRPVAITHSAVRSIHDHPRCKPDHVIKAIGEANGYFGVVVLPVFLGGDPSTLDTWLRHFDRAVELAGADHVGIGTDTEGAMPPSLAKAAAKLFGPGGGFGFRDNRVDLSQAVKGFESWYECWPNLTAALLEHGYPPDEVRGFIGGNFLRVFRDATD